MTKYEEDAILRLRIVNAMLEFDRYDFDSEIEQEAADLAKTYLRNRKRTRLTDALTAEIIADLETEARARDAQVTR